MWEARYVMSRVSSGSLFHYTKTLDIIISILENGFYPRCAVEDYSFILTEFEKELARVAIPMVCFCDLPEELQEEHKSKYGNYGLALSKKWGLGHGICPVMYIPNGATSITLYNHLFSNYKGIYSKKMQDKDRELCGYLEEALGAMIDFTGFMKQYNDNDITYYDEREWRYIVSFYDADNPRFKSNKETNRLIGEHICADNLKKLNLCMEREYPLYFSLDDIEKIIVPAENERIELIDYIEKNSFSANIGKNGWSDEQIKKLNEKIQVV